MRLIDADVLTKDLEYYFGDKKWSYTAKCLIKDMPTAYDPDKVVEQLTQESIKTLGISETQFAMDEGEYSSYCSLCLYDAIGIVKSGGTE